jgi:hypothetical protein
MFWVAFVLLALCPSSVSRRIRVEDLGRIS